MSEMLPPARSRSRWRDANRTQVFSSSNSLLQSMHAPTDPPHDIDDWDYKYKLERGRLISTNLYSSSSSKSAISSSPTRPRCRMSTPKAGGITSRPAGNVNAWIIAAQNRLSSSPDRASPQKISLWHDPDPEMKVVDVQSDSEFMDGLDGLQYDYSYDHNRRQSPPSFATGPIFAISVYDQEDYKTKVAQGLKRTCYYPTSFAGNACSGG